MENLIQNEIEVIKRGVSEIITEEDLIDKLKKSHSTKTPLKMLMILQVILMKFLMN